MMLDMAQYTGMISTPNYTGWDTFAREFEATLDKYYSGFKDSYFVRTIGRWAGPSFGILSSAFTESMSLRSGKTMLRCYINFYAVFMVFAHKSSRYVGQTKYQFEMLLECEKYLVPSDASCALIISMLEECFFPSSQRQVGRRRGLPAHSEDLLGTFERGWGPLQVMMSIKEGFLPSLKGGESVPRERSLPVRQREYRRARAAAASLAGGGDGSSAAPDAGPSAEDEEDGRGGPPRTLDPWRAASTTELDAHGNVGHIRYFEASNIDDFSGVLTEESQREYEEAIRYVVVHRCRAKYEDAALTNFADRVAEHMSEYCRKSNYEPMDPEHIKARS
jgi:hypothetical protein